MKNVIKKTLFLRSRIRVASSIKKTVEGRYMNFNCNKKVEGEEKYIEKWSDLLLNNDPYFYRLYSQISGIKSPNFLPDDVYVFYILRLLNDSVMDGPFKDKNFYDLIFKNQAFPKTYMRNVNGIFFDNDYRLVEDPNTILNNLHESSENVVVKPTWDSTSGKNVKLFTLQKNGILCNNGTKLSHEYLNKVFKNNYIIQQAIHPSNDISVFNTGSVNSIRMYSYRSVKDNKVRIVNSFLKVGPKGSFTDNISDSGYAVAVDDNGNLGEIGINKYGVKTEKINNVDLKNNLKISSFGDMKKIVIDIAEKFIYDRFIGFDVTKDFNNKPVIIEANLGHVGVTACSSLGKPIFGSYTDEIIEYCKYNKNKVYEKYQAKIF